MKMVSRVYGRSLLLFFIFICSLTPCDILVACASVATPGCRDRACIQSKSNVFDQSKDVLQFNLLPYKTAGQIPNSPSPSDMFSAIDDTSPNVKKISEVHDNGFYNSLCWVEITTITEYSNGSKKAYREYAVTFETPSYIPEKNTVIPTPLEEDSDVEYQIFDKNTKKSETVKFHTVKKGVDSVIRQHRRVMCGAGPIYTKDFIEWPQSQRKRIEIRVSPKNNPKNGNFDDCNVSIQEPDKLSSRQFSVIPQKNAELTTVAVPITTTNVVQTAKITSPPAIITTIPHITTNPPIPTEAPLFTTTQFLSSRFQDSAQSSPITTTADTPTTTVKLPMTTADPPTTTITPAVAMTTSIPAALTTLPPVVTTTTTPTFAPIPEITTTPSPLQKITADPSNFIATKILPLPTSKPLITVPPQNTVSPSPMILDGPRMNNPASCRMNQKIVVKVRVSMEHVLERKVGRHQESTRYPFLGVEKKIEFDVKNKDLIEPILWQEVDLDWNKFADGVVRKYFVENKSRMHNFSSMPETPLRGPFIGNGEILTPQETEERLRDIKNEIQQCEGHTDTKKAPDDSSWSLLRFFTNPDEPPHQEAGAVQQVAPSNEEGQQKPYSYQDLIQFFSRIGLDEEAPKNLEPQNQHIADPQINAPVNNAYPREVENQDDAFYKNLNFLPNENSGAYRSLDFDSYPEAKIENTDNTQRSPLEGMMDYFMGGNMKSSTEPDCAHSHHGAAPPKRSVPAGNNPLYRVLNSKK